MKYIKKLTLCLITFLAACGIIFGAFALIDEPAPEVLSVKIAVPAPSISKEQEIPDPVSEEDETSLPDIPASPDTTPKAECGHLAFEQLDSETRAVYSEILRVCAQHMEKIRLSTLDPDIVDTAFHALICDYGGMFWANGYTITSHTLGGQTMSMDFCPSYTCSLEEREGFQQSVNETLVEWLAAISTDASDYEKVKYVYELLACNVTYNTESRENQNILSVFLFGESVCNGYASAAQYMLTLLDVPCMIVYGTSQNQTHAWNLAYIEGEPYFFDVTWGSALTKAVGECSYAYLNLTSRDIRLTHEIDMPFSLPECTATDASYYIREGLYFTDYDKAGIEEVFASSYNSGHKTVSLKFSGPELYRQVFDAFITNMEVAACCPGLQSISYVENKELCVLTVHF